MTLLEHDSVDNDVDLDPEEFLVVAVIQELTEIVRKMHLETATKSRILAFSYTT